MQPTIQHSWPDTSNVVTVILSERLDNTTLKTPLETSSLQRFLLESSLRGTNGLLLRDSGLLRLPKPNSPLVQYPETCQQETSPRRSRRIATLTLTRRVKQTRTETPLTRF